MVNMLTTFNCEIKEDLKFKQAYIAIDIFCHILKVIMLITSVPMFFNVIVRENLDVLYDSTLIFSVAMILYMILWIVVLILDFINIDDSDE